MNAILLGAASLAALLTFLTAETPDPAADLAPGEGSMTTSFNVDSASGEQSEILTIAFMD